MRNTPVLALLVILTLAAAAPATQPSPAQDRLDAIVQQITARGGRGAATAPPADPSALLIQLRAIDPAGLAPAADGTLLGEWQINPFDAAWDEAKQKDYLLEHDWGVILVTAPH